MKKLKLAYDAFARDFINWVSIWYMHSEWMPKR